MLAVLARFAVGPRCLCVELHATLDGDPLYRSFGFEDPAQPQLRLFGPPSEQRPDD